MHTAKLVNQLLCKENIIVPQGGTLIYRKDFNTDGQVRALTEAFYTIFPVSPFVEVTIFSNFDSIICMKEHHFTGSRDVRAKTMRFVGGITLFINMDLVERDLANARSTLPWIDYNKIVANYWLELIVHEAHHAFQIRSKRLIHHDAGDITWDDGVERKRYSLKELLEADQKELPWEKETQGFMERFVQGLRSQADKITKLL